MSEREHRVMRQVVARLMAAQEEAVGVCNEALVPGDVGDVAALDDGVQASEEVERLRAALEDVRAILDGASADVRGILGEEAGGPR